MYTIYKIENKDTEQCYIGRTANYTRRTNDHKSMLRRGSHRNKYLQEAYDKNPDCYTYSIIEIVDTLEESYIREEYFVNVYKSKDLAYNIMGGGHKGLPREYHPNLGRKTPDSVKEQISRNRRGKSLGEDNHFYGKKHSVDTKSKISESRKGQTVGGDNPYSKSVYVNGIIYGSVTEGREAVGMKRYAFRTKLLDPNNEDFKYIDEGI